MTELEDAPFFGHRVTLRDDRHVTQFLVSKCLLKPPYDPRKPEVEKNLFDDESQTSLIFWLQIN